MRTPALLFAAALLVPAGPAPAEEPAAPRGAVQGILVRSLDESPIPDAAIALWGAGAEKFETRTDAEGWFRVEGVPLDARFTLAARAAGLPGRILEGLRIPHSGTLDFGDLEVGGPATRSFRVVDRRGRPISGASIEYRDGLESSWEPGASGARSRRRPPTAAAATDAEGRATLEGVPPGSGWLEIRSPGTALHQELIQAREGEVRGVEEVVLGMGHVLRGRVIAPDGAAVPSLCLLVRRNGFAPLHQWVRGGPDGRFALDGLSPGKYEVQAYPPGGVEIPLATIEVPGVRSVELVMDTSAELEGSVLDAGTGKPMPGVPVSLEWRDNDWVRGSATAVSDDGGSYRFRGLPPGPRRSAQCPAGGRFEGGFVDSSEDSAGVQLRAHASTRRDLRWRLGPSVRGRATVGDGAPVARVLVSALMNGPFGHRWATAVRTGPDGAFRLPLPCEGKGCLELKASRHFPVGYPGSVYAAVRVDAAPAPYTFLAGGDRESRVDVVLQPGGVVEGTLVGPTGVPVAGAVVRTAGNEGTSGYWGGRSATGGRTAPTDAAGAFRIRNVAPVHGTLFGWADLGEGQGAASLPATLPGGPDSVLRGLRVTGTRPAVLEGRVVARVPEDLDAGELRLVYADSVRRHDRYSSAAIPWSRVVPVGADGAFRAIVEPGEWALFWAVNGLFVDAGPIAKVAAGEVRTGLRVDVPSCPLIEGRLVDESGAPIEAARLWFQPAERNTEYERGACPGELRESLHCTTDAEGRFALQGLRGVWYDAEVSADGRTPRVVLFTVGDPPVAVTLKPGRTIRGRVVDEETGDPLPGIRVESRQIGRREFDRGDWRYGHRREVAHSDADGAFTLRGLEDRPHEVVAEDLRGGAHGRVELSRVMPGDEVLEIGMRRRVEGRNQR